MKTPEFGKPDGRTADPSASLGMTILFGNAKYSFQDELSSRPERTRIACHATLDKATCAPFCKEGRMKCTNATKFHRKSGVASWRDLRCARRAFQILEFSRRLFSPFFREGTLFRWTEVQLPPAKAGGSDPTDIQKSALQDLDPEGLTDRYISVWLRL